jgi:hypothetical protein
MVYLQKSPQGSSASATATLSPKKIAQLGRSVRPKLFRGPSHLKNEVVPFSTTPHSVDLFSSSYRYTGFSHRDRFAIALPPFMPDLLVQAPPRRSTPSTLPQQPNPACAPGSPHHRSATPYPLHAPPGAGRDPRPPPLRVPDQPSREALPSPNPRRNYGDRRLHSLPWQDGTRLALTSCRRVVRSHDEEVRAKADVGAEAALAEG